MVLYKASRKYDYSILLVILLSSYWYLFKYANQYDFLDCWLPWRHFISKSFHNGIFPIWNPYQQLGYPNYADLSGPLFSPENFITSNLFTIQLSTLQAILFCYLLIGIIGFYELGRYLYKNNLAAILSAASYILGGMVLFHFQHFFSVISFSLIPLTLVALLKFLDTPKWKYVALLIILFHLQITTANQTFNIINIHFILFFVIRKFIEIRKNQLATIQQYLYKTIALCLGILIVALPTIVSFLQTQHFVDRYDGLTYQKCVINKMTIPALWSFINPYQSNLGLDYLHTDQSMSNYFIGYINIICVGLFLVFVKTKWKWHLVFLAVLFFLIALGDSIPLHKFLFR